MLHNRYKDVSREDEKMAEKQLKCGAACGDITPAEDELGGLEALQRRTFGGVIDPLHVRVLALNNGEKNLVFVCFELDKAPYPMQYIQEIAENFHLSEDDVFMLSIHAHAVPITGDRIYDGPNNIKEKPEYVKNTTHRYERRIHDIVMKTVADALSSMRPAVMGTGTGTSMIGVDRKAEYHDRTVDETIISLGMNPSSPIDRTVKVIRFDDMEHHPIAFFVNFPVHCTVMHGNSAVFGKVGISSDIGGRVSAGIERKYPGSVCMWTSGAAGDINPLLQCEMNFPDPQTGKPKQKMLQGDSRLLLTAMADIHLRDVMETIEQIHGQEDSKELRSISRVCRSEGKWEPYEVRIHMAEIGELLVIAVSGELYSYYSGLLQKELPGVHMLVVNHDASNAFNSGYIPGKDTLQKGKCQLPGVSDHMNMIPENFEKEFLKDVKEMYDILQAEA
jgi:hypothetical protein